MSVAWPRVRLGEVLRQVERPCDVEPAREYRMLGVRWYGAGLFERERLLGQDIKAKRVYRVEAGDFVYNRLFAWKGSFAAAGSEAHGAYVSNEFPCFAPAPERLDPAYLRWWFMQERTWLAALGLSTGATPTSRNRLKEASFLGLEIPLPPLAEQRRIVSRLDALAASIGEAQALQRQSDVTVDALVSATIAHLCESVAAPVRPLSELLLESPRNGLGPRPESANGIPMLRINAVSSSPTRDVDVSAFKRVDVREADAAPFFARAQDVFVVRYNGDINRLARAALFREQPGMRYIYPDKLIRLRPDPGKRLPEFLVLAFGSRLVRGRVEQMGKTTAGNLGISGKDIKSFLVPVPPLDVQARLVRQVDRISELVAVGKATAQVRSQALDALLPATLDRAFAGRL